MDLTAGGGLEGMAVAPRHHRRTRTRMALFGRDRHRLETDQKQALNHPVRIAILDLFTKDRQRPLDAESLLSDLLLKDPEKFGKYDLAQIAYHRARLQDAELLPSL